MEIKINVKAKILIDADVLIHFIKGEQTGILHKIFPNELYLIDIVFEEVFKYSSQRVNIENLIRFGIVREIKLDDSGFEIKSEYHRLTGSKGGNRGKGESAIMSYCRYNADIIASSNLADIVDYCNEYGIIYITTMDFLAEAFRKKILTEKECDEFIKRVKSKGSRLIASINHIRDYKSRITNT
ncbi:MAG: hypothetical protein K9H49_11305 [Bacteroidales bacterium]|nr:hypothetical protein [Bacteroidales bacterium]MCF8390005.1 hypothetical protein [Bacteroidales bacterium]